MLKDLGAIPAVFPMPVLMVATYGEDGKVDVMNVAWGGICGMDKIALNLAPERKTLKNIQAKKAFTVSLADEAHIKEADFLGTASGNVMSDKFERTELTAVKSSRVDAPVIQEFPVTMECRIEEVREIERRDVRAADRDYSASRFIVVIPCSPCRAINWRSSCVHGSPAKHGQPPQSGPKYSPSC